MIFNKINGVGGPKAADKSKKSGSTQGADGSRFADMLQAAGQAETMGVQDTGGAFVPTYTPLNPDEPRTPKQAGKEMLETLEDLAADMLTATPSQKAAQLQALMDNLPNPDSLNPEQRKVWDELATRAATTLEKLKQK